MILYIGLYYLIINIVGFFMIALDKHKAKNKLWRIKENKLLMIAFFGGALGVYASMLVVRHKTRRWQFSYGVPLFLMVHCLYVYLYIGIK